MAMSEDQVNALSAYIRGEPYADQQARHKIMAAVLAAAGRELSSRGSPIYLPEYQRSISPFELEKVMGMIAASLP